MRLALGFSAIFGAGVATRVVTGVYRAVDLGLEGSLLAGILGGYVTGLFSGILISIPAMFDGEYLSMPLFAGVGVLGGLLRDVAPDPEEIWRFSPFLDRAIRQWTVRANPVLPPAVPADDPVRRIPPLDLAATVSNRDIRACTRAMSGRRWLLLAIFTTTLFTVTLAAERSGTTRGTKTSSRRSSGC